MGNERTVLAQVYTAVFKLFSRQVCKRGKNRWAGDGGGWVIPATRELDAGEATARPWPPSPGVCGNWQRRRWRGEIWADPGG